jgi:cAMP-dependent protein kinase regulator
MYFSKRTPDPSTPPCISSTLGPGGYFGEIVLLSNKPRQATVTAVTDVRCLSIGREHFNQVMGPCEVLSLQFMVFTKRNS